jgi:hypothetical protein
VNIMPKKVKEAKTPEQCEKACSRKCKPKVKRNVSANQQLYKDHMAKCMATAPTGKGSGPDRQVAFKKCIGKWDKVNKKTIE